MIRIAICDDEPAMLNSLSELLKLYRSEHGCEMEFCSYQSPLELMAGIERGARWDILLLDILMPGENGMELAREIRAHDSYARIIFLTSSAEFALESYSVDAYYYLLKPIHRDKLFPILERAVESCVLARSDRLVLKCKAGLTAIDPDRLEYCEVIGRSLLLHMQDGKLLESHGKLNELEDKLFSCGSFLRVHRSFLVNMAYIRSISYRAVTLACQAKIPVPHGKYNDIKNTYLAYAFENERMPL